jgi:tRNA (guanine37-N1)-methyltransferase
VTKRIDIFTLVPQAFDWFLDQHPLSTAAAAGAVTLHVHNLREYGLMPHHEVDDTPYGGGPGMVTRVDVVAAALEGVFRVAADQVRTYRDVYVLAAGGRPFDHAVCRELAVAERDLVLLCGRFEGFDARVEALLATGSLSVGPYVLAGGEVAALLCRGSGAPSAGSLGNADSVWRESFSEELGARWSIPTDTLPRYSPDRRFRQCC